MMYLSSPQSINILLFWCMFLYHRLTSTEQSDNPKQMHFINFNPYQMARKTDFLCHTQISSDDPSLWQFQKIPEILVWLFFPSVMSKY